MAVRGAWRWPMAAALVAAAVVAVAATERFASRASVPDSGLEARVLSERIDYLETLYERSSRYFPNPVVGAELVDDHLLRFRLDNDLAHLNRAEEIAEALAPLALNRAPAYARLSLTRLARHDFAGASKAAETAIEADSTSEGALGVAFDAAVAAGRYEFAARALESLERGHTGTVTAETRAARWLDLHGDADAAFARLEPACRRLEASTVQRAVVAWCQTLLAEVEHGRRGATEAEVWYERALRTQPQYTAATEGLADLAYARGEWERARDLYERILADAHPDLSLRLAEVSRALGRRRPADEYEAAFLGLATADGAEALNAHPLAIYFAGRRDRRDRALEIAHRDLERRSSTEAWEVMAWVRFQRGEFEQALAASDAARAWGTPDASSDYVRGRILGALGRDAASTPLIESALADPTALDHHLLVELRKEDRLETAQ